VIESVDIVPSCVRECPEPALPASRVDEPAQTAPGLRGFVGSGRRLAAIAAGTIFALAIALVPMPASGAGAEDRGAYQGLWWAAPAGSEAGWGLNLAHQGDTIFATWFTYDAAGDGWWLSMTATRISERTYSGTLLETTGPAYSAVPFDPAEVSRTPVGTGTLTFSDRDRSVFSYSVKGVAQSKPITRQLFGPPPSCAFAASPDLAGATNVQDLWWVPTGAEAGWGINFSHQGDQIFATWFTYDTDGTPLWLSASMTRTAPGAYGGSLFRTTGPAFGAARFDPAKVARTVVGTASLAFANGNAATFAYTVNGLSQSKTITRELFAAPAATICTPGVAIPFQGNIVLGAPTAASVRASVFSPSQSGTVWIAYGTSPGVHDRQTASSALAAGAPLVIALTGLAADTRYYYRLFYQAPGASPPAATEEYTFHTARPPGSAFTFTIQADSHLDENSDLNLYRTTLRNIGADAPDFHVDLGDTFMTEKHADPLSATSPTASAEAEVDARYRYEQGNFGLIAASVPLFLVNGNHEGEAGWLADGTARNLAVWTSQARERYFANPVPDGFYSGDAVVEPFVGQRASWYAWQWGDALFVVLDPYWYTKARASSDGWAMTLGERQFRWLEQTLSASAARYKFVFIHSLVGGLDGQMRGGVEAAPYFEWGGRSLDGSVAFAQKRNGWSMPIHPMLVKYGVTAVFHGHDHLYAKQVLDGVVYQEVPQPSAKNFSSGPSLAAEYHYASGTILSSSGHLRVTVSPERVLVQYVRAWLPANETPQRTNGQVDDSWSVAAHGTR
jgi:hypothetical protein